MNRLQVVLNCRAGLLVGHASAAASALLVDRRPLAYQHTNCRGGLATIKSRASRKRMNVAFLGVSGPALPYLDALARRSDVAVTAVCDPDRRAAEQIAAGWEARVFADADALLLEGKPEALWICAPPHLQAAVARRAIEQRVPFLLTPPGACDFSSAAENCRLARKAKLVASVGFLTRHTDVVGEAREYLGANPVPLALGWWLRPPHDADGPANAT